MQPGTGMPEGKALTSDADSLSEFVEKHGLWLLIPLALGLFGLAKFLTTGTTET
ncbi:MAG: hypothetical protein ACR2FI_01120 [Burkholderiales bacterium]|nr:hypothetical protein [Burkholderiales bacterium]MDQ3197340.1 hypothetical protein [Pseudomonadota bacterium]